MKHRCSVFREMFNEVNNEQSRCESANDYGPPGTETPLVESASTAGCRNLKAARSESWPWTRAQISTTSGNSNVPKRRSEGYIDILQSSSQRGFSAPPRHEIQEYQRKSLPPTPSPATPLGQNIPAKHAPSQNTASRVDSFLGLNVEEHDECKRESVNHFAQQSGNAVYSKCPRTWMSRVQKRAENNQKAHGLLQKGSASSDS